MKSAWDRVKIARKAERPKALDYINELFTGFIEFHGDRKFGDDKAIIGGIAYFDEMPVTVIGEQKGKNSKENLERNFGMPNPEGYRNSLCEIQDKCEKYLLKYDTTLTDYYSMYVYQREKLWANRQSDADLKVMCGCREKSTFNPPCIRKKLPMADPLYVDK